MRKASACDEIVFLLPGFLGFDQVNHFVYFADRVTACLRAALDVRLQRRVPVVPLSTLPTHPLAARQRHLLRELHDYLDQDYTGVKRIHLVGHSTGGVDAFLLACERGFGADGRYGADWRLRERQVVDRVATVTSIAAPFYGTGLASSSLAQLVAHLPPTRRKDLEEIVRHKGGALPLLKAVRALFNATGAHGPSLPRDILFNLLRGGEEADELAQGVLEDRRLLDDLTPESMASLMAEARLRSGHSAPRLTCFVTATSCLHDLPEDEPQRGEAELFRLFYNATRQPEEAAWAPRVIETAAALNGGASPVISSSSDKPPSFDATVSDGVVNSASQWHSAGRLGALVMGDHADVIGHYDRTRRDPSTGRVEPINDGLFQCGASFNDNEFFALYEAVANGIAG
jgi:pimeloyl-ACP methyl ester carboxylesterase